jgi:hypothetical protein
LPLPLFHPQLLVKKHHYAMLASLSSCRLDFPEHEEQSDQFPNPKKTILNQACLVFSATVQHIHHPHSRLLSFFPGTTKPYDSNASPGKMQRKKPPGICSQEVPNQLFF